MHFKRTRKIYRSPFSFSLYLLCTVISRGGYWERVQNKILSGGEKVYLSLKKNFIVHLHNWVRLVFTSECAIFIAFAFMVGGGKNGSVSCTAS